MSSQLATLLKAGLVLDDALGILEELVENEREKASIRTLIEAISSGKTLAEALAAQKRIFPDYFVNLVRAGEAGGNLDLVFDRIAEFIARRQAAREHVKSAMLYPIIVAIACCVSITILLVVVVPQFQPLFEQSAKTDTLPLSTQWLMALSNGLRGYWWLGLMIVTGAVLTGHWQVKSPKSRLRWQRRILNVPLVGALVQKIEVARFSRTLGTLLKSEVPLLTALAITRDSTENIVSGIRPITAVIGKGRVGEFGAGATDPGRSVVRAPAWAYPSRDRSDGCRAAPRLLAQVLARSRRLRDR